MQDSIFQCLHITGDILFMKIFFPTLVCYELFATLTESQRMMEEMNGMHCLYVLKKLKCTYKQFTLWNSFNFKLFDFIYFNLILSQNPQKFNWFHAIYINNNIIYISVIIVMNSNLNIQESVSNVYYES